jgi:hypothetical protein
MMNHEEIQEAYDKLTNGQTAELRDFTWMITEMIAAHSMVHYLDEDHVCDDDKMWAEEFPDLTPDQIQMFFAVESAGLDLFSALRKVLVIQGYPVTSTEKS